MSNPKVSVTQGKAIVNEVLYRFPTIDAFTIRFTEFRPHRPKSSSEAVRKWLERVQKGWSISRNDMGALLKALNIQLRAFEKDILQQPGFCLAHYGVSFVRELNEHFSKTASNRRAPIVNPSLPTHAGENLENSEEDADSQSPEFSLFFGPAMKDKKKDVQLLFPMRVPTGAEKSRGPAFGLDTKDRKFEFVSKDGKGKHTKVYSEGVSGYLSFEAVRAATHITNFVTKTTRKDVWVRHEHSFAFDLVDETCIFSFGLGFSVATWDAQDRFDGNLFSLYCDKARQGAFQSDYFRFQYTPIVEEKAGVPFLKELPLRRGHDIALIVRVIPEPKPNTVSTGQPWFLIAGRSAPSTTAAAYFLAKRWQELAVLYRENNKNFETDSLAVVIEHNTNGVSTDHSHKKPSQFEQSANIFCWDRTWHNEGIEKCIAWG